MSSRTPSVMSASSSQPRNPRTVAYAVLQDTERTVPRPVAHTPVVVQHVDQNIQRRLNARNYQHFQNTDVDDLRARSRTGSETSSMLVSQGATSSITDSTPTLGHFSSIEGSVFTVATNRSYAVGPYALGQDENGLAVTREARLPCYFRFLPCDQEFNDLAEWDTHCKFHFKGKLPQRSSCPIQGCVMQFKEADCELTWQARWTHIQTCHAMILLGGVNFRRPDEFLLSHLRNTNVIDLARYKHLQLTNPPLQQAGHLRFAGSLQDQRRNRPRKDSACVAE